MSALVVGAVLAGCGSSDETERSSIGDDGPVVSLSLDADGPGGTPPRTASFDCADPSSKEVCRLFVAISAEAFDPVPGDRACTEIFGGPDVLSVEGTRDGQSFDAKLTRANGCEIERFDQFVPLLEKLFPGYKPGGAIAG